MSTEKLDYSSPQTATIAQPQSDPVLHIFNARLDAEVSYQRALIKRLSHCLERLSPTGSDEKEKEPHEEPRCHIDSFRLSIQQYEENNGDLNNIVTELERII